MKFLYIEKGSDIKRCFLEQEGRGHWALIFYNKVFFLVGLTTLVTFNEF